MSLIVFPTIDMNPHFMLRIWIFLDGCNLLIEFIAATAPEVSSAHLAEQIEQQFEVRVHRRTVERARR